MIAADRNEIVHRRVAARTGAIADVATGVVAELVSLAIPIGFGLYMYYGQHATVMAAVGWGAAMLFGTVGGAFILGLPGLLLGAGGVLYFALRGKS